jgi:hypothetical protein
VSSNGFDALATQLPDIVAPLHPLADQWDRLSLHKCFMVVVRGPYKVDFLFVDVPNPQQPPWQVRSETLSRIDAHFWDWVLWLGSKQLRGQSQLVESELGRMTRYLLVPMGARQPPISIDAAVNDYTRLRAICEAEFGVSVDRELENEVKRGLQRTGVL